MNLIKAISGEEAIGGLEIESGAIRFALLKKTRAGLEATTLIEEKLNDKETIGSGNFFVEKLSKFAKKNNIKYVIVSIPTDAAFVKTFSFPAAMPDEKIEESMKLTSDLQLPKKKEEIYCDWMPAEANENDKKILLSYIPKVKADAIIGAIKKSGLKVVALEPRAMSLARMIKQAKDEAILAVEKTKDSYSFSVLANNNLLFSQSAPADKIGDNIEKEIKKITNYYGWFNLNIKSLILIGDFTEAKNKKSSLKIMAPEMIQNIAKAAKDEKWLIVLGAAMRGLIPRKEDEIISLMDIGTEIAYKREKANSTANFFIGINTALALFFLAAFFSTWSLISVIQNNYIKQISSFNLTPSAENATSLQEKASEFNNLVEQTANLARKEPKWSLIIEEVKNKTVEGISVNNLSLPSIDGMLSLTGTAKNREAINKLKNSFESSTMLTDISLPLDNLGKKADIPFSLSFKLNSEALVYGQ